MDSFEPIINHFKQFFVQRDIKFVIGGSLAIKMLAERFNIQHNINPNNIDIFYLANTPITPANIGNFNRINDPCRSMTYTNNDVNVNVTMMRNNYIDYFKVGGFNIMNPEMISTFYTNEDFISSFDHYKFLLCKKMIPLITSSSKIYKTLELEQYYNTNVDTEMGPKRVLFNQN
jgi:hypothetical protein